MIGGGAIKPTKVATGGVHPLVKASMLPRIKQAAATGLGAQSKMLSGMARSGGSGNMTHEELSSKRSEVGRKPRA